MNDIKTKKNEESQLEHWILENPENFESGIKWIGNQKISYWHSEKIGIIDLKGVDENDKILIVELKAKELNHKDISQALCYYISCSTHEGAEVRLCLVGPGISTRFRIVFEWINKFSEFQIECKIYEKTINGYSFIDYNPDTYGRLSMLK